MDCLKILLVNPRIVDTMGSDNTYGHPPLGILYLASFVEQQGYEVDILDLSMEKEWKYILMQRLENNNYRVVGISGTTPTHDNIKKIAIMCKKKNPYCTIIAGGPHASFAGVEILNNMPVDIVIHGEGEQSLLSILNFIFKKIGKLESIPGLLFRDVANNYIDTGESIPIKNIDDIPFPAWEKIDMNKYTHVNFPVITSRGCPGRCIFCSANAMAGGKYRRRTNENIIRELILLHERYKINSFLFADNTFTAHKEKVIDLCDKFRELSFHPTWYCESRLDVITPELIKKMSVAGCQGIQLGVESANQVILDTIKKKIQIKDILVKINQIFDNGISNIYCTFVMGLPGENIQSLQESIELIKKLHDMGVVIETTLATPFPGTYLADYAEELGVRIIHKNYKLYLFNEITSLPKDMDAKTLRDYFIESKKYCG